MPPSDSQIKSLSLKLFVTALLIFLHPFSTSAAPEPSPAPQPAADDVSPPSPSPSPSPAPSPSIYSPPAPPPSDLGPNPPSPSPAPAPGVDENKSPAPAPAAVGGVNHENQPDVDDMESNEESSGGMSRATKAGVALGVIAGLCVAGFAGLVYKKRQQNLRRSQFGSAARRDFL